jgi:nicotinamidase-related amidase
MSAMRWLAAVATLAIACSAPAPAATSAPTQAAVSPTTAPTAAPTTAAPSPTLAASPTVNPLAVPAVPAPVAVSLDAKTTAIGVFDVTNPTCGTRPECTASVPKIAGLLTKARAAGVLVLYSSTAPASTFPAEIAPRTGDVTVQPLAGIADLFLRSSTATPTFDQLLKDKKITTLLITGTRSNGVVMYTSFGATARGYTVVVPVDTMSGSVPFESNMTAWQLLNQPGFANAENKALAEKAVTLTRSDLVTFK